MSTTYSKVPEQKEGESTSLIKEVEKKGANGLPVIEAEKKGSFAAALIFPVVSSAIGLGFAAGINHFADANATSLKLASIKGMEGEWIYASSFLFSQLVTMLNFIPMAYKDEIMTGKSGNLRSNMFIYKSLAPAAPAAAAPTASGKAAASKAEEAPVALIGLEEDGTVGKYNRANRSLLHFVENSIGYALAFPLAAYVFPKQTFYVMSAFFAGRIAHQIGYTTGYGGHGVGFLISTLCNSAINGINLFVVAKSFGYM